jgi:hypothetical protein
MAIGRFSVMKMLDDISRQPTAHTSPTERADTAFSTSSPEALAAGTKFQLMPSQRMVSEA